MHEIVVMSRLTKLALINLNNYHHFHLNIALFHSTPGLEVDPRRRTHWEPRPYSNAGRQKSKQELLKKMGAHYYDDEYGPVQSHRSSWFKNDSDGFGGYERANSKRAQSRAFKKGFQCYEDDEEVERKSSFWSSSDDESPRNSSARYNNNRGSWNRKRFERDDDNGNGYNESSKSGRLETDVSKERIALGLSGSGPLSLEHVKDAYRTCALKWHPDRHDGSSKEIAEEKFKVCSAAYQSLCEKLAEN